MQTFFKTQILLLLSALFFATRAADESAVVNEGKINVRGQPSLIGEVVTQLQRGDQVSVLEYVKNDHGKAGEPTNWAKIKLPANTPVWVYAPMVKDGAVAATKLNLRAGPGDNYSVIGRLVKGDKINQIRTMGDWIEIEAPAGAYAFVDANLIKAPGSGAATVAPAGSPTVAAAKPQPTPRTVKPVEPAPILPAPSKETVAVSTPQPIQDALAVPTQPPPSAIQASPSTVTPPPPMDVRIVQDNRPSPTDAPPLAALTPAAAAAASTPPPISQPLPKVAEEAAPKPKAAAGKRVVRREGIVRATRSIQAPTWYELVSADTKKTIDYLYEEKLGIKLKEVKGQKVIVSGEEAIDPRWPNTPILEMETLDIAQ